MLGLNDFLWFPSKTKLNVDFWVEFHFEFLVLFSYEELSETWEVQTLIEWSWKTICKTPCYGVLFHTFDLCGCWEQHWCLFQPINNRPVEATTFLCRGFDIQATTSNPSHHPGTSWKAGNPRVCPSPSQGPSKPAGTTMRNTEKSRCLGLLLTSSSRKRKASTFLSSQLVPKSQALLFGLPIMVSMIHEIPLMWRSHHRAAHPRW